MNLHRDVDISMWSVFGIVAIVLVSAAVIAPPRTGDPTPVWWASMALLALAICFLAITFKRAATRFLRQSGQAREIERISPWEALVWVCENPQLAARLAVVVAGALGFAVALLLGCQPRRCLEIGGVLALGVLAVVLIVSALSPTKSTLYMPPPPER